MTPEPFRMSPREFAASELFARTFEEGMDLVEETAAYLEGPGRRAAKDLSRLGALAYAGESMRLTTQLMQVASWLLVHRAVRDGEMSDTEAFEERFRITRRPRPGRLVEGTEELPERLLSLVEEADRVFLRIARLDARIFGEPSDDDGPAANPVADHMALLNKAFGEDER